MANLRGASLEKQAQDAFHRLESFGVSRHKSNDHLTHSDAVGSKREQYLREFLEFSKKEQLNEKLNLSMTPENLDQFFSEKFSTLSKVSQEDYVRGFSSMLQGLAEKNIDIPVTNEFFNHKVAQIKEIPAQEIITGRAIKDVDNVIKELYSARYESGVIAEIQLLGFRISESMELMKNPDKYISNGQIVGLIGKGNHIYDPKPISPQLIAKINSSENIPSQATFRNDLSAITDNQHTPHDFRYAYAHREYHSKIQNGVEYHQALKEVSQGLNHSRKSMSLYYLKRV